jgi:cytidylate kinase
MPIVLISSRFQGSGEELAMRLVEKTAWPLLNRQQMQELARDQGIKIGRLETSIIKAPGTTEHLARERHLYLKCLTAALCERAVDGNLVYYGRAGHLLLPGISHRLRVGLATPYEGRVRRTAETLNLSLERAELYLQQLDEDFEQWYRFVHRVEGRSPDKFDVFLNLEHLSISNAASLVCDIAALADFKPTPVSTRLMDNLRLAAQAELRLAFDPRTTAAELQVQADNGVLTVTYSPREELDGDLVAEVIGDLTGCREILCTVAETNILWVQEKFDPGSPSFGRLTQLARRWGAAVELLRLIPSQEGSAECMAALSAGGASVSTPVSSENGGVEDDQPTREVDDGGLGRTREELLTLGQSAGQRTACGGYEKILDAARGDRRYSLVVIGDVFLSKAPSARTRMTRELALAIRDRLKAPVIVGSELESKFMFGPKQAVKLLGFAIVTAIVYAMVFYSQDTVLSFLSGDFHQHWRWATPFGVVLFVPLVAYLYGTVAGLALKLINID